MSMRVIDRTRIATGDPVILDELQGHLRIEAGEIPGAMAYASAAGDEVARFADLALLTETIVAETDDTPPAILPLPIGPAQADATVTVESVAEDGSTTTISTGWHLRPGRHPELRFAETPEAVASTARTVRAVCGIESPAIQSRSINMELLSDDGDTHIEIVAWIEPDIDAATREDFELEALIFGVGVFFGTIDN